jgi:hypothetical protein
MTEKPAKPGKRGPKPGTPQRGGVPKGYIFPQELQKQEGKARLRELVLTRLDPIVEGLIGKAMGVNHMMLRDDEGKWKRLESAEEITAALNAPDAEKDRTFWIHTKDPDVQAAADLLNRAIGKPIEEVQAEVKGGLTIRWKDKED